MGNGNSLNRENITSFTIVSGNLNLDNTNSSGSIGVITFGTNRTIHNAGPVNSNNIFVGTDAGNFTLSGFDNTAVGRLALSALTSGTQNTAVGVGALANITTGTSNTAVGWGAMTSLPPAGGSLNTAVGYLALNNNVNDQRNTAIGASTLIYLTTGTNNTAVGAFALMTPAGSWSFSDNTAVGYNALSVTTGSQLTAVGSGALQANVTGQFNTAVGYQAINTNVTGSSNTGIGYQTLSANKANNNTAFGYQTLKANTTGTDNLAIGTSALATNTTGISNTAVGSTSLSTLLSGNYNITLGFSSGSAYTSSESSNILIGSPGGVGESHVLRVGQQGSGNQQQNTCFVAGINSSAITGSPVYVDTTTGQLGVAVVGSARPAFTASFASNTANETGNGDQTTGTVYNLLCTTIEYDTASNVSPIFVQTPYQPGTGSAGSTATCFTCPVTGVYMFNMQALLQTITVNNHEAIAGIYNFTAARYIAYQIFDAATDQPADALVTMNLSGLSRCTAGNVITTFVFVLGESFKNIHLVGGPGQSFFSGYLVS